MSLPVPSREYSIQKLANQLLGDRSKNSRDLLIKVKDATKASGWWTVLRSSDGVSITSTDQWTDYTKLVVGSWITLRNVATGVQWTILITVTGGWTEMLWYISPSVGFTGGTPTTAPSATDQYTGIQGTGADWLGTDVSPDANPQFRAYTWVSTDGKMTRVAWWYGGNLIAWWQLDEIVSPVGVAGSWVPFGTVSWDGGNAFMAPTTRFKTVTFLSGALRACRGPAAVSELPSGVTEEWINDYYPDKWPQNLTTNQYYWTLPAQLTVNLGGAGRNGAIGFFEDQWWVGELTPGGAPVFLDGDTGDGGNFIFLGQMLLPWDGTTNPPGIAAPTDRPTTSFFGRLAASCTCGPDDCDTPTTPLVTLRNGAKELADKVDDDSVSDITWNLWINQGVEDLWKKIVEATGDAFLATYDFALTGGAAGNFFDVTTIPARDFRRLRLLELNPDTANRRRIKPFNLAEKDDGVAGSRWGNFDPQTWDRDRRYRRMGNKIYVERYELAAGSYRLYYEPKALTTPLAQTCDALPDVLDEWAEYMQVFAAMKALGKEESDPGYLPTRLAEMRADIAALKGEPDDDADASVIADVEDGGSNGSDWP